MNLFLNNCLQVRRQLQQVIAHGAILGDGVGEWNICDLGAVQHNQATKFALVHQVDGGRTVTGGEHTIERRRSTAALGVAKVDSAGLETGALFDLVRNILADAQQASVPELVNCIAMGSDTTGCRHLGAFRDHNDTEKLPPRSTLFDDRDHRIQIDGLFRHQNGVRPTGDSAVESNPPSIAAHHFTNNHAAVGFGSGVEAINCFRGNADRRIESKTDVSAAQIVIDGLGHADARYTLLNQSIGHALRIVSANRDQRVQLIALNGGDTLLYTARLFADVRTRGAQNGSSQLQDPRDALNRQRHRLVFQN